jgi:serine/threonine protein kinase/WD40 repeat protein
MNDESKATADDDALGRLVESFLARLRRGEHPSVTDLVARHPELAAEIHELVPALVKLERFGESNGTHGDPSSKRRAGRHSHDEGPPPERLGDYVILRRIGGGGMGVVYEAEHQSLKSRVALKVVHPRFRADPKYLRRFHAEARVAAGLHHTNIVSVFDYGDHDGVCYYAMPFIEGQPLDLVLSDIKLLREEGTQSEINLVPAAILTIPSGSTRAPQSAALAGLLTGRFALSTSTDETANDTDALGSSRNAQAVTDGPGLPVRIASESPSLGSSSLGDLNDLRYFREIARIGAQVADAMEYAHCRGVLHRDIKPSNLILDAQGNVWIADFGLAKVEEGGDLSHSRELVGTLRYMAPERIRGISDRRGDIYSLGATLYELLTLRPPFEGPDQLRLIELIKNEAPAPPRHLGRSISRDLGTIVLKALAKDPHDRFASAGELASELRRFVEGRPIRSRPVSVFEQIWRWCKRDPWLAGANIAAALLITVLAVVSTVAAVLYRSQAEALSNQARALSAERGRSDRAAEDARWRAVDAYTAQAQAGRFSRRPGQRFDSLEAVNQAVKLLDGLPPGPEIATRRESLRDLAIACMALRDLKATGQVIRQPPGVIMSTFDPKITRYALIFRDGTISVRRVADDHEIASLPGHSDRELWMFGFSPDGRYLAISQSSSIGLTVWDVGERRIAVAIQRAFFRAATFSPDSRRIVLHSDGQLLDYDLAAGKPLRRLPGHGDGMAFRPDGAQLAVVDNQSMPPACRILDWNTGRLVRGSSLRIIAEDVAWNADGTTLAICCRDAKIDLLDAATLFRRGALEVHYNGGLSAVFDPTGTLLASNGWENHLRLWDPILGRPIMELASARFAQISEDGRIVVARDDQLSTYQLDSALEYRTFSIPAREGTNYGDLSVRHDGRLLAIGTEQGAVLWDLARGTELAYLPIGNAWHLMFDRSGDLITGGATGVYRWPIRVDEARGEYVIDPRQPLRLPAGLCGIGQDRSGTIVAKAADDYVYVATPLGTRRLGPFNDCRAVAVSPDGQWLATGMHVASAGAQVWRISDLKKVAELPLEHGTGVTFSADGRMLMTTASPCRLWEVGTWRELQRIVAEGGSFSPDSRLVAVQDTSRVIRLVETQTGRTLARLESPDLCGITATAFSPDGSRLVVTTQDGPAVHVWDLGAIRRHLARMGLDWDAPAYPDPGPAEPSSRTLRRLQINDFELAIASANVPAYEGRWNEAALAYARAFAHGTSDRPVLWFERAIVNLATGDRAAYSSICQHLLKNSIDTHEGEWLIFAAHALVLDADSPTEALQELRLAEKRLAHFPDEFSEHVMGLAQYRAGRFAEAEARLMRNDARFPGWRGEVLDRLVVAMAQQKLGRNHAARRSLMQADQWIAARLRDRPGGLDRATPENWPWRDGILMHLLREEAHALVDAGLANLPADAFAPPH